PAGAGAGPRPAGCGGGARLHLLLLDPSVHGRHDLGGPVRRLLLTLVALALVAPASSFAAACDKPADPAGEWPSYGHDLNNSRSQPAEKVIGTGNAGSLAPAFVYQTPDVSLVQGTPLVDGGCVFVLSQGVTHDSQATIAALDAKSGAKQWSTTVDEGGT